MKAKLIKTVDGYELFTQGFLKGSTNHGLIDSLNVEEGSIRYKLSLKNCQAIENGYDLEKEMCKLVDKKAEQNNTIDLNAYGQGCLDAFQKALELMGDKKFSEFDITKAFEYGWNQRHFDKTDEDELREIQKRFIQSLQQTEWDVSCNPDEKDSEGCLILKRL